MAFSHSRRGRPANELGERPGRRCKEGTNASEGVRASLQLGEGAPGSIPGGAVQEALRGFCAGRLKTVQELYRALGAAGVPSRVLESLEFRRTLQRHQEHGSTTYQQLHRLLLATGTGEPGEVCSAALDADTVSITRPRPSTDSFGAGDVHHARREDYAFRPAPRGTGASTPAGHPAYDRKVAATMDDGRGPPPAAAPAAPRILPTSRDHHRETAEREDHRLRRGPPREPTGPIMRPEATEAAAERFRALADPVGPVPWVREGVVPASFLRAVGAPEPGHGAPALDPAKRKRLHRATKVLRTRDRAAALAAKQAAGDAPQDSGAAALRAYRRDRAASERERAESQARARREETRAAVARARAA